MASTDTPGTEPSSAVSDCSTAVHVFHYLTHSIVWTLVTNVREVDYRPASCYLPTADGAALFVFCDIHLTRSGAEKHVAGRVEEHAVYPDALGAVEVLRHRDEAAPSATSAAPRG